MGSVTEVASKQASDPHIYTIYTAWRHDGVITLESTGVTLGARSDVAALAMAHRRGTGFALSYLRSYVGLVALCAVSPGEILHTFETTSEAWTFYARAMSESRMVGYPTLSAPYVVREIKQ